MAPSSSSSSSSSSSLQPHFTITTVFLLLLFFPTISTAVNVTAVLSAYPDFSGFNRLLSASGVAGELASRSSLTLLAVPDSSLLRSDLFRSSATGSAADLADVLRYHVLLQYLSWPDLRRLPPAGKLVATLYQTTGRASADLGAVNLTRDAATGRVAANSNSTVLSQIKTLPYNLTILSLDSLLVPYGFDLSASSESHPQQQPLALNITRVLIDGRDFNVAASMLEASGVVGEFEEDERGAGITIFVPTDEAFAGGVPATDRLQSLPADRKAVVLRFHVLHSYYPLGSLESIVNPVQPTLATEGVGAGRFTLNISRANGSVAIDTGVVQASVTRTVFDQNPVAVFAVSRVLLPKEIFGKEEEASAPPHGAEMEETPPPDLSPEVAAPPAVSSPPAMKGEVTSSGGNLICIEIFLYLLVFLILV